MPPIGAPGAMPHTSKWQYQVLYRFNLLGHGIGAGYPHGVIDVNGTLYGTTELGGGDHRCSEKGFRSCGLVYSLSTSGGFKVLHYFKGVPKDGAFPGAGLIDVNGTLYGTTGRGGSGTGSECSVNGCGTVYSVSASGAEKVLYSFAGGSDGWFPNDGVLYMNGALYGTTTDGQAGTGCVSSIACGVVFSLTTSGVENVLYTFSGGADGGRPSSGLIKVNGTMYGTTYAGGGTECGPSGCGVVYSVTTSGQEKVLHSFTGGVDGSQPNGLVNVKGTLYGTTDYGGAYGNGTVYSLTTSGNKKVVYSFRGGSDAYCLGGPLAYAKGTLYGTSICGGGCPGEPCGTVYSVTTTGSEHVLYGFTDHSNGFDPDGPVIDVNGTLYGTTLSGGGPKGSGRGVLFALSR